MRPTESFTQVIHVFTERGNKSSRQELVLLLGSFTQQLGDDYKANCRRLGQSSERIEAYLSLLATIRTIWAITPQRLFTTADPNFERIARSALETSDLRPTENGTVLALATIYRRLWQSQKYGRSYISSLDLDSNSHVMLLEAQQGRCALCRYEFSDFDLNFGEAVPVVKSAYPEEVCLERYYRSPVLDHIVPQFLGGDGSENWQILCASCNSGKGDGLAWIMRRGLLPASNFGEASRMSPSLRFAVLSNYYAIAGLGSNCPSDTGQLHIFKGSADRLPVFDNLVVKTEREVSAFAASLD